MGRIVPDRTVVYINDSAPPRRLTEDIEAETRGTYPLGSLVHDDGHSRPEHETLRGSAVGLGPGRHIGVDLSCEVNCLFDFYLQRQHVVLEGVIDGRFRHDGLAIAEQAQALFERWHTNAPNKGNQVPSR